MFFLLLSNWIPAEQVQGVILTNFYSLSFLVRNLIDSPKAKFPIPGYDWDLAWDFAWGLSIMN